MKVEKKVFEEILKALVLILNDRNPQTKRVNLERSPEIKEGEQKLFEGQQEFIPYFDVTHLSCIFSI